MSDDEAIRDLIATWQRATTAGDADAVLRLMADDVVFLTVGRPPMIGKAAFAAGLAAMRDFRIEARGEIRELVVQAEIAWCWNDLTVVVTPRGGGPAITRAGPVLPLFRKKPAGAWVLIRDANLLSLVPS